MEKFEKLILGDDNTPRLDSPFGNRVENPKFISIGHNIEKRDLQKEVEEAKKRQDETENLFYKFKLQNCKEMIREERHRLSTGCRYIDEFLEGGFPCKRLIEIYGEGGSGKTNFGMQLLFNSILSTDNGGLGGKALYCLTKKHLPEKRFNDIKTYFLEQNAGNITSEDIDEKIKIFHLQDLVQYKILFESKLQTKINDEDLKLIIIDDISSIAEEFIDATKPEVAVNYFERANFYTEHSANLKKLAYKHNVCIIALNTVVTDMMGSGSEQVDSNLMYNEKFNH